MLRNIRALTVAAVLLSMFMSAMEATVVATAMPTVVAELGGLELYGWTGSVYMLATVVTIPLYGKLADVFGRKPIMLFGLAVFLVGSMASGLSRSMVMLIAFRAVQGIGAGALQPIALTIIGDLFTIEQRAKIQGLFGAVWGIAGMCGPLLGGLVVRVLSWRWVFYINLPFGLLSGLILAFAFRESRERTPHSFDFLGAALLSTASVTLLMGLSRMHPAVTLPAAIMAYAAFVLVERSAREPIFPLSLLRKRVIAVASVSGLTLGSVMMATVLYVPLYVQAVFHGTPTDGGVTVAPMLVGWPLASALSARFLVRTGFRVVVRTGAVVVAVTSALLAWLLSGAHGGGLAAPRVVMFFFGAGLGMSNSALLIAVQNSVGWEQRGVATSSTMFFRSVGGAMAVGALGAVLAASIGPRVPADVLNQLLGPDHGRGLGEGVLASTGAALEAGLGLVFWIIAGIAACGLVSAFLFPETKIVATPGPPLADGGRRGASGN